GRGVSCDGIVPQKRLERLPGDDIARSAAGASRSEHLAPPENLFEGHPAHSRDDGKNPIRAATTFKTIDPRLQETESLGGVEPPNVVLVETLKPVEIAVGLGRDHHEVL